MYEHKCVLIPNTARFSQSFQDIIAPLESEGWEIVSVVPDNKEVWDFRVFLKRMKYYMENLKKVPKMQG